MLMRPGNRRVHAHVPGDQAFHVSLGLQLGEDPTPGAVTLPAPKESVNGLPLAVAGGDVTPGRTGPRPSPYAVDQLTLRPERRPPRLLTYRQQRLQPGPLLACQISTPHEWIMADLDPLLKQTLDAVVCGVKPPQFLWFHDHVDLVETGLDPGRRPDSGS